MTAANSPLKILLVGDSQVGKTTLLSTFTTSSFPKENERLYFIDQYAESLVCDGVKVDVMLCDTAGLECYDLIRTLSYPDTDVVVVCFGVDCLTSYENVVGRWYPEIRQHCPNTPIVLVATKIEKRDDGSVEETISTSEGEIMQSKIKAVTYVECSAKTGNGLKEVFEAAVKATKK